MVIDELVVLVAGLVFLAGGEAHLAGAEHVAPGGILVEHVVDRKLHGHIADGPGVHHVGGEGNDAVFLKGGDDRVQLLQRLGHAQAQVLKDGPAVIHALIEAVEGHAHDLAIQRYAGLGGVEDVVHIGLVGQIRQQAQRAVGAHVLRLADHDVGQAALHVNLHLGLEVIAPVHAFPFELDVGVLFRQCGVDHVLDTRIRGGLARQHAQGDRLLRMSKGTQAHGQRQNADKSKQLFHVRLLLTIAAGLPPAFRLYLL